MELVAEIPLEWPPGKMVCVHAGLVTNKLAAEQLALLRARDGSSAFHAVGTLFAGRKDGALEQLRGRSQCGALDGPGSRGPGYKMNAVRHPGADAIEVNTMASWWPIHGTETDENYVVDLGAGRGERLLSAVVFRGDTPELEHDLCLARYLWRSQRAPEDF